MMAFQLGPNDGRFTGHHLDIATSAGTAVTDYLNHPTPSGGQLGDAPAAVARAVAGRSSSARPSQSKSHSHPLPVAKRPMDRTGLGAQGGRHPDRSEQVPSAVSNPLYPAWTAELGREPGAIPKPS